ncbi:MAG TPA: SRPBCC family protein [Acidimicrobiia bacterium]|nr:SRPBCC family protein [Acidimicrobiia bacterium]
MIQITMDFAAPPQRLWEELADLASHSEWMADAEDVRFVTDQRSGVGTQMRVPTRIGPLRTNDLMTVVEWEEGRVIAVEHVGAVSGVGRFEVVATGEGARLLWSESLRFPWWLGGRIGAWVAGPILARVWRGNLARLGERVTLSDP